MTKPITAVLLLGLLAGCTHSDKPKSMVGQRLPRQGDEIMVAGQLYHTGAPVVLWTDPGGYDAYRTERRFADWNVSDFENTFKETQENKRLNKQGTEVDSPNRFS